VATLALIVSPLVALAPASAIDPPATGQLVNTVALGSTPVTAGLTVHLYLGASPDPDAVSDSNGDFTFSGIPDGTYPATVYGTPSVGSAYYLSEGFNLTFASGAPLGALTMTRAQTISGTVTSGGIPLDNIMVNADSGLHSYSSTTDVNGDYLIPVAFGEEYAVSTYAFPFLDESWDDHHGCGCEFDPVASGSLGAASVTGIDFDLIDLSVAVIFDIYTSFDNSTIGNDYGGVTVHLYRKVSGSWVSVDSGDTDVNGLAPWLFGPSGGDYRVRFSDGTRWLAVQNYEDDTSPGSIPLVNECFVDFPGTADRDFLLYNFTLDELTGAGRCGNPAVPSGGSTTKHPTSRAAAVISTTPTPTPSPSHTQRPRRDPREEPTPTPSPGPVLSTTFDPWGLSWIFVVLLLVAGITVVVVRRRMR
jgi:hypothetical protein